MPEHQQQLTDFDKAARDLQNKMLADAAARRRAPTPSLPEAGVLAEQLAQNARSAREAYAYLDAVTLALGAALKAQGLR
jgi:hypothetical protein